MALSEPSFLKSEVGTGACKCFGPSSAECAGRGCQQEHSVSEKAQVLASAWGGVLALHQVWLRVEELCSPQPAQRREKRSLPGVHGLGCHLSPMWVCHREQTT